MQQKSQVRGNGTQLPGGALSYPPALEATALSILFVGVATTPSSPKVHLHVCDFALCPPVLLRDGIRSAAPSVAILIIN